MRDEARGEYLKPSVRERKAEFSRKQVSCLKKIPPYTGDGFLVGRKMVKSSFLSTDSYNCTRLADRLSKFEILTSKSNNLVRLFRDYWRRFFDRSRIVASPTRGAQLGTGFRQPRSSIKHQSILIAANPSNFIPRHSSISRPPDRAQLIRPTRV